MKKSSKFSNVLHILLHMDQSSNPATSEKLAKAVQTNPVVVRRIMAGLRERGLVQSTKGHGGGWELSCNLMHVTLYDIYKAIGAPTILAIGNRAQTSKCLVEKAVNAATGSVFQKAEMLLTEKFKSTTLADLRENIKNTNPSNHAKRKSHAH